MLKTARAAFKFGNMGSRWIRATKVDPGDGGQVAQRAWQYICNLGLEPEDAWLMSLLSWIEMMPCPDTKRDLELKLDQFLDQYEGKIALSAITILAARDAASRAMEIRSRQCPPALSSFGAANSAMGTRIRKLPSAPSSSKGSNISSSPSRITKHKKKWAVSRSTRQLTYRPTDQVFEPHQYHRDSGGAIAGFVLRDNQHLWVSDIDIELVD